ncbi:ead/Ea22-like family protein [Salmonella enterica subsp. enterica]|nr:ead/Ea22-like family protein [Salmonella enterica]EDN7231588.1 ead/Ea22-like family protein [Salmonella enterica subsp. enterica]
MTIDKRALREVAEKATPGTWRRTSSLFNGITVTPFSLCGEEVTLAHTVEKRDAEFIAAANPATMLALLDENIQLQREKDATEAVALALLDELEHYKSREERVTKLVLDNSASWDALYKKVEAAEKHIAELEARKVNLSKLSVGEVMHMSGFSRDYAEGWCAGNDNAIHEIRTAGIKVKE